MPFDSVTPTGWRLFYPDGSVHASDDPGRPKKDPLVGVLCYAEMIPSSGNPYRQLLTLSEPGEEWLVGRTAVGNWQVYVSRFEDTPEADLPNSITYRGGKIGNVAARVDGLDPSEVTDAEWSDTLDAAMASRIAPGGS